MIPLPALKPGPAKQVFADIVAHPGSTSAQIAERTGLTRAIVTRRCFYLEEEGYVQRTHTGLAGRGNPSRWTAIATEAEPPKPWPADVPRELPTVTPINAGRPLRQSVGVVILLDQNRRAA